MSPDYATDSTKPMADCKWLFHQRGTSKAEVDMESESGSNAGPDESIEFVLV